MSSKLKSRPARPQWKLENPAYARQMAELRRSHAAGVHNDKRTRRARTRNAALRQCLREF